MVKILNKYARFYEDTTGRVQFDTTIFFSWKSNRINGKFEIEIIDSKVKFSNIKITQFLAIEAVRTLGVHVCPQLQWD